LAFFALAATALYAPAPVAATGTLGPPHVTAAGTFGGIAYVQYDGLFEGQTSTGAYRVPYRITAPADPRRGNGTVLVEPPHAAIGTGMLDFYLGRSLLFTRGFAHASVGWSTTSSGAFNQRILDPSVHGV